MSRRVALAAAALVFVPTSTWFLVEDARNREVAAARKRDIEARGGFALITEKLQQRVAPLIVEADRPARFTDLSPGRLGALASLAAALDPYPPGFVKSLVDTVALADDIRFWGDTRVGGCFFERGLAVAYGGDGSDTVDPVNRDTFHHELSSHVRLAAHLDDARWAGFNAPDVGYLTEAEYRTLVAEGRHLDGDPTLYAAGFVRPYGRSDIDDDWNTYAERVFGQPEAFAAVVRAYPRVRAKTQMMLDTYQALDGRLATFFASSGLRAAVAAG